MSKMCYGCFKEIPEESDVCPHCGFREKSNRDNYPQALPLGTVLNAQYIIGRVLGQGGFGITYIAQDYESKSKVAVKEYFPSANATRTSNAAVIPFSGEKGEAYDYGMECFVNEALILARFSGNLNIANVDCCFKENGTAYYVMEYVDGKSFEKLIQEKYEENGGMSWDEVAEVIDPVLNALAAVHSEGIIHRDIAPDNICIMRNGTVKLLDFGAARYSLGDATRSLDVVLKHGFAPKEQYSRRGKQGPYTDIYATAATMYYAITGHKPPDAIERTDRDELALPSAMNLPFPISYEQEGVLLKALSVDSYDRYQSAAEFQRDLREVTLTPEKLYQKALTTMAVDPTLSAEEQLALYRNAIAQFEAVADMRNAQELAGACSEKIQECEKAIQNVINSTIQTAQEKASTDPSQEQAEKAYRDAIELVGGISHLLEDPQKQAECERIQKTCEDSLLQHTLVMQLQKAKEMMKEPLPNKERRMVYQGAKALLEEVKRQTTSPELQDQCNQNLRICEDGIRRLDDKKKKLRISLAAGLTAIVAVAVGVVACLFPKPTPLPTQEVEQVPAVAAMITGNDCYMYIILTNADNYSDLKFAVRNEENGQSNPKWYTPERHTDGWVVNVKLTDLADVGKYNIEAFGSINGETSCLAGTTVVVDSIMMTELKARVLVDNAAIAIEMDEVPGYDNIKFAVWGNEGEGNDLTWHQAENHNGKWIYNADLLDHNELGLYFIHAYGSKAEESVILAHARVEVSEIRTPELYSWVDANGHDLQVLLEKAGGNTHISVAVWRNSEGQDGVHWYSATPADNGDWTCTVDLREFNGPDTYTVQVFGRKNDVYDEDKPIGAVSVGIENIMPFDIYSSASVVDQTIWLGMICPEEYQNIRFAVWATSYGQEDLKWYTATLQDDGSWQYVVDLSEHMRADKYLVHAYAIKDGMDINIASTMVIMG